ncbi:MAG: toxin-antitoxin system HicB family antitoxin [Thiohalospira sp.]
MVPEKPFKDSFNVRISAELHQRAAILAMEDKMSLNKFVVESIREKVFKESTTRKKPHTQSR